MDNEANLNTLREILEMTREQTNMISEYRNMLQNYSQMCNNYYSYICEHRQLIYNLLDRFSLTREPTPTPTPVPEPTHHVPMQGLSSLTQVFTPPSRRFRSPLTEYARQNILRSRLYPFRTNYSPLRVLPFDINNIPGVNSREQYTATDISNTTYDSNIHTHTACPIGLDDFIEGETISVIHGCGHIFKRENLERWLSRNSVCPVCRYDIVNRRPASNQPPQEEEGDTLEFVLDVDVSGNVLRDGQYDSLRQLLYNLFSGVTESSHTTSQNSRTRYETEVIVDTDSDETDEL